MWSCWRRTFVASLLLLSTCCSLLADHGELLQRAERALTHGSQSERVKVATELIEAGFRDPDLQAALSGDSAKRDEALRTLMNLRRLDRLEMPPIPAGVSEQTRRILQDPVFAPPSDRRTLGEWLAERIQRFLQWLASLTSRLAPSAAALDSFLTWVGFVAAAVAVAVGVTVVVLRRLAAVEASAKGHRAGGNHPYTQASSREWLRLADESAALGDLRAALRYLLLAALARLDEAGIIRHEPGLTNGEYVRRARRHDAARFAHLQPLVLAYDGAWYGSGHVTAEQVHEAREHFERVDAACQEIAR
ncbi:MAG: hypothetical protein AMXMBFR61_03830 [Fimbriimonadales bacterium]